MKIEIVSKVVLACHQSTEAAMVHTLTIPFRIRGYDGQVAVLYWENQDPTAIGFDRLNLPFDISITRGFPVFQASVSYSGSGYNATLGWIQVVTVDAIAPEAGHHASVDVAPIFRGTDSPFAAFGQTPTTFDAPGPNPPRTDEHWVAETFLVACPDVARTRVIQPILGIRWGYQLTAMEATPLGLEIATADDWERCAGVLRSEYPSWIFDPSFAVGF